MAAAWEMAGNPSSVHAEGRQARRLVEDARAAVATAVSARPQDVVFAFGGTEANMLALTPGLRRAGGRAGPAAAGLGHRAYVGAGREAFPADAITAIKVTGSGLVDLDHLRDTAC